MEADLQCPSSTLDDIQGEQPIQDIEQVMYLNEKMRIGINGISMLSPLTGIGQYTHNLVRELHLLNLSPWLFYGTEWRQTLRAMSVPGMEIAKSVFKSLIPRPYGAQRFLLQQFFSRGTRQHKINLYHEPNFMPYRFQGPAVVTVHDLSWMRYPETQPAERVREMNRVMPAAMQSAAHILVDSEFVRKEVMTCYGLSGDRVTTALLGVSDEFKPQDARQCAPILDNYNLKYGQYILSVATHEPRKNLASVVAAFSQLAEPVRRRYPLVIAGMHGWGESLLSDSLQKMIARGEVRLTGYVPQTDLPSLYAGARLFVYPSLYEGFGLPPLEAMACGAPVIVSDRASLPEVVGNAGILTEPLDDTNIALRMMELIEDDSLHDSLSAKGRKRADGFTWRRCAIATMDVYRNVLSAC